MYLTFKTLYCVSKAEDPSSIIEGVVAEIPVPDGADAVKAFLSTVAERTTRDHSNEARIKGLKGGRVPLWGGPKETCKSKKYAEGLSELVAYNKERASSLHWEWCCRYNSEPKL